ncbi:MAG: hypothetical protein CMM02_07465, partial [Rhodopirellula sp.]|nr:hypothetical protein [Rhodopirellula sp.]
MNCLVVKYVIKFTPILIFTAGLRRNLLLTPTPNTNWDGKSSAFNRLTWTEFSNPGRRLGPRSLRLHKFVRLWG